MKYLCDTDVIIDFLEMRPHAVILQARTAPRDNFVSTVSVGEVYHGIYHGRDPERADDEFGLFLRNLNVLPFDVETTKRYGYYRGVLTKTLPRPGDADIMIAATAIQHGLTLATRNRKHFERIDGLKLYEFPSDARADLNAGERYGR